MVFILTKGLKLEYQMANWLHLVYNLTELSCKSGIYQESGPKGPDF